MLIGGHIQPETEVCPHFIQKCSMGRERDCSNLGMASLNSYIEHRHTQKIYIEEKRKIIDFKVFKNSHD